MPVMLEWSLFEEGPPTGGLLHTRYSRYPSGSFFTTSPRGAKGPGSPHCVVLRSKPQRTTDVFGRLFPLGVQRGSSE